MPTVGAPTLDQLQTFLAVVDEGSFVGAARRLNRAVSAISYAVSNLEAQLGLVLLDREGSRKPVLTEAGHALLADARLIAADLQALRARALALHSGLEPEVSLALDVMIPLDRVAGLLREFQEVFPTVTLRLHVEALGGVAALLLDGRAHLGISGPAVSEHPDLERSDAGSLKLVPVASPDHPLARARTLAPGAARGHLQLVLTDRSNLTEGRDFTVASPRTWRLADLGAKLELLREGIGWGNMPVGMIEEDLAQGRLVELPMGDMSAPYPLSALWRRDRPPGKATNWLLRALVRTLKADPES
ncbi:MAG TPA: LysR family transcriptional regulator [Allosphingosinicella sp.]|jgi:DNA-binding transcriptional LysR family regulator|uniref:LysR family transcriptional regulator n=1 Tax=Allosphingosinicella sp. TaxID=2823234 RepID=UPI002F2A9485